MRRRTYPLWLSRKAAAIVCGVACAVVVPIAYAASPLASMTPKAMAAKIHGFVPQIPTDNTSAPSEITATVCHGLGAGLGPVHARRFNTFRCSATWYGGKTTVWARALPGKTFCASGGGLAACPLPPAAAGDPRICSNPPAPPTADPDRCARESAEGALIRAMRQGLADPSWTVRNLTCKGQNLGFSCLFSSFSAYGTYYTSAISFALGSSGGWSATFVTTGGGGTGTTCTVQPDPTTAAGAPSVWTGGPTPTCTNN